MFEHSKLYYIDDLYGHGVNLALCTDVYDNTAIFRLIKPIIHMGISIREFSLDVSIVEPGTVENTSFIILDEFSIHPKHFVGGF